MILNQDGLTIFLEILTSHFNPRSMGALTLTKFEARLRLATTLSPSQFEIWKCLQHVNLVGCTIQQREMIIAILILVEKQKLIVFHQ